MSLPVEFTDGLDHSKPWYTANGLASRCRYVWNYAGFVENDVDNHWAFAKTDVWDRNPPYVAQARKLDVPYTAFFTANSDAPVEYAVVTHVPWFTTNLAVKHSKIHSLALSIGNAPYGHGDTAAISRVLARPIEKQRLFFAQYAVQNNPSERSKCLAATGVPLDEYRPFESYLTEMRKSYFCISPAGAGIDCHRTWEALIVGTVPVVTRSLVAEEHSDWPVVILDDWSDFKAADFTKQRYADLWGDFQPEALHMDNYLNRLRERFGLR